MEIHKKKNTDDLLVDFITGKPIKNIGVEEHRQKFLRFLVEEKGYYKTDIHVDADIKIDIAGSIYQSKLDIVVSVDEKSFMVIKCAAGSLESREREVLSAARIFTNHQIPYSVAADGDTAVVYDTVSGKKVGEGLNYIPARSEAKKILASKQLLEISGKRREKEKIIFRSYDSMNINVSYKARE
jgi:hypothetical protein